MLFKLLLCYSIFQFTYNTVFMFIVCMTNFQQYDKIIVAAAFFQQVAPHTKY